MTSSRPWGDHDERRLTLIHIPGCDGSPVYAGGTDQRPFCADGCISFGDGDFHLPVGKLGEFVVTLYEAAGLTAPVILERPELPEDDHWAWAVPGGADGLGRITLDGGRVVFQVYADVLYLTPGAAREAAAVLAASADLAAGRAAQDALAAEVEELAQILRGCTPGMAVPADGDYGLAVARGYAEAALRWFRDRNAAK